MLTLQRFLKRKPQKNSEVSQFTDSSAGGAAVVPEPVVPERLFGLRVLHEPKKGPNVVSLVFVHGLGGSAKETWTHNRFKTFWPNLLHEDDRFANVRISTFGYNADFSNIFAARSVLGIPEFAKQLLNFLDLYYEQYGDVSTIDSGPLM